MYLLQIQDRVREENRELIFVFEIIFFININELNYKPRHKPNKNQELNLPRLKKENCLLKLAKEREVSGTKTIQNLLRNTSRHLKSSTAN